MAVTIARKTPAFGSDTDAASYSSASFATTVGKPLIIAVTAARLSAVPSVPTVTHNGVTGTLVVGPSPAAGFNAGTNTKAVFVFRLDPNGGTAVLTVAWPETERACWVTVDECTGAAGGAALVGSIGEATGASQTTQSCTIPTFQAAGTSVTWATMASNNGGISPDHLPGAGWTELGENGGTTPVLRISSQWEAAADTTVNFSTSIAIQWAIVGLEVKVTSTAVTGTGAITAARHATAATGTEQITGTAALTAAKASLASGGAETFTGSGAFAAVTASFAGTATESASGTGAFAAAKAVLSGAGLESHTGSGAFAAAKAAFAATGTEQTTGTGAFLAKAAVLTSTAAETFTGTGGVLAKAAVLGGTAAESFSGPGAFLAKAAVLAGEDTSAITGTGALAGKAAVFSSTYTPPITGTGATAGAKAAFAGVGAGATSGIGGVIGKAAALAATGVVANPVSGTGALAAAKASLAGIADVANPITGTGAFTAPAATFGGFYRPPHDITYLRAGHAKPLAAPAGLHSPAKTGGIHALSARGGHTRPKALRGSRRDFAVLAGIGRVITKRGTA